VKTKLDLKFVKIAVTKRICKLMLCNEKGLHTCRKLRTATFSVFPGTSLVMTIANFRCWRHVSSLIYHLKTNGYCIPPAVTFGDPAP